MRGDPRNVIQMWGADESLRGALGVREKDPRGFWKPPHLSLYVGIPKPEGPSLSWCLEGTKPRKEECGVLESGCLDLALSPALGVEYPWPCFPTNLSLGFLVCKWG